METAMDVFGSTWRYKPDEQEKEFHKELEQLVVVALEDVGGSYEWDVYYVYWHTGRKRFYVAEGSGCSCNWISEDIGSLGDFQEFGTRNDVIRDFKSTHSASRYGWTQQDIDNIINAVRDFRE